MPDLIRSKKSKHSVHLLLLLMLVLPALLSCTITQIINSEGGKSIANIRGEDYHDNEPLIPEPAEEVAPGSDVPSGDSMSPADPTVEFIPIGTSTGDDLAGNLKPICFLNTGTEPATVMAWTYVPLNSETPAIPSDASTVAFPGGNSSACLSLPLGTYTWCYHWELGDVDDDGMIDYAHSASASRSTLDESATDDLDLAEKVSIVAPSGLGELPGQCELDQRLALDIRPFIVDSKHLEGFYYGYAMAVLAHHGDYVTLKGPITVEYYFHHCDASPCTTELIREPTVRVTILAGETQQFYLEETFGAHLGNWDLFVKLVSINE
jgi:hypothetical protein